MLINCDADPKWQPTTIRPFVGTASSATLGIQEGSPLVTAPPCGLVSSTIHSAGNDLPNKTTRYLTEYFIMGFPTEPTSYEKTALSDLQGAWIGLRAAVVDNFGFPDSDKLLFHIDEAMSWESVRNLERMKSTLLLVQNIISQSDVPEDVMECVGDVRESLEEVFLAIEEGEKF